MIKRTLALMLALACAFSLTGCLCRHEFSSATCTLPATCSKCGDTEGEAAGHLWSDATCTEARSCAVCSAVEGSPLGHDWLSATCTEASRCSRCGMEQGEAAGHSWQDATTETPRTCAVCNLTEGERIITDPRFTTAAASELFGPWSFDTAIAAELIGIPGSAQPVPIRFTADFANDGSFKFSTAFLDEAAVMDALLSYSLELSYQQLEAQGISREAADEYAQNNLGMSMTDYVRQTMGAVSLNDILARIFDTGLTGGVYYVQDGSLYLGFTWDTDMIPSDFSIEGDALSIASLSSMLGPEAVFRRMNEADTANEALDVPLEAEAEAVPEA